MILWCRNFDIWDKRWWYLSRVKDRHVCWSRQMDEGGITSIVDGASSSIDSACFAPFLETVLGAAVVA